MNKETMINIALLAENMKATVEQWQEEDRQMKEDSPLPKINALEKAMGELVRELAWEDEVGGVF